LDFISRRLLEGHSMNRVEALSRATDKVPSIKAETIAGHLKHMTPEGTPITQAAHSVTKQELRRDVIEPIGDVAVLVQREVVRKLESGEARVTVQHGLQAQMLLDRRSERAKDRELAVTLARLLHTPPPPSDLIEARPIIDGDAVRLEY
jgi:hypothetical protein